MDRAILTVNKTYTTRYSWWLAPSLFYIPSRQNARTASVSIKSAEGYSIHPDGEQFYGLNLDTLSRITRKISSGQPDKLSVKMAISSPYVIMLRTITIPCIFPFPMTGDGRFT